MAAQDTVWTPGRLLERLERAEPLFVFDVRNRDEAERFRLEGRTALPGVNLPYFEMLELGGRDDMVDSVVACVERELEAELPRDLPVLAVCAKGETSEFVAEGLRRLGYESASLAGGMRAWGTHYVTRPVVDEPALAIHQVMRIARGCLSYVVSSGREALVIDPLRHLEPYLELARARGVRIAGVIDTHAHADHISGGPALAARTGAPYYLHPYDGIHPVDMVPPRIPYEPLREGQALRAGKVELAVLHAPGHTLGLVALRLDDRFLLTGDSIFIRSIARPDLGGKADVWAPLHTRSLRRLAALPEEIVVLPGHFSSLAEANERGLFAAPLGQLARRNDGLAALRREDDAGFVRYLLASLPAPVAEYMDIKRVNAGLLSPDEDDAFALELGKNVCALSQAYATTAGEAS